MHHLDSWIKRDQLDVTCFIISIFTRYNNPQSAYALHILQNKHEYGQMNSTVTLLKPLNNPNLLLPYE